MDELRKTPERTLVTDVDERVDTYSPLKPLPQPVAGHNAEELAERTMPTALKGISTEAMWKLLGKTEEYMQKAFPGLPTMETTVKELKRSHQYKPYTVYLNRLSDAVHKKLDKRSGKPSVEVIRFFDRHNNPPKDHPTGTGNRPDFLAMKLRAGEPAPSVFHWSALEATGELLSGNDKENSCIKSAAYTSYLLQARPDMVTVQGIYMDPTGFRLVASNACGAFDTNTLDWKLRSSRLLLCAWIWHLYEPVVDPSITANFERDKPPTFDIAVSGATYPNCTVHSAGTAFGRRTIVFACPKPEILIKEQYIETSRRFEEGQALTKIHEKGTFPGVVRLDRQWAAVGSSETELVVKWKESERKKTRVVLLDKAPSIMDAKTLQEALVAMYDLLEITRFLYKKRKILHRDISRNNVRLRDVVPPAQSSVDKDLPQVAVPAKQSIAEELHDMCFASYLLHTKRNSSTTPGRLDTGIVLIDFDMSEDQERGNQGDDKKAPHARTGTPIFAARAVISGMRKEGEFTLQPMPQLDIKNEAYEAAVPDRLQAFPLNEIEHYQNASDMLLKPFKHKLQYDAESVFWLLLWWAILACPVEDPSPAHKFIDQRDWAALTSKQDEARDPREAFIGQTFPKGVVHPVYKPLETLLKDMAKQLRGDHEQGMDPSRRKDEYLHEAFQRLILNFLFTHYDERFMTVQKELDHRKPVKEPGMEGLKSSSQIDRARASVPSFRSGPLETFPSGPSGSSHKRKRSDKNASGNSSNSNDGEYKMRRYK